MFVFEQQTKDATIVLVEMVLAGSNILKEKVVAPNESN